jgi:putative transposase
MPIMAMRVQTNPLETAYALLLEHGLDGASEALRILVDEAAKIERSAFLGAGPYERTATCRDDANGFKPKTILTRVGELTFQVPQVRSGDFYPCALEKGTRTDQAVNPALAEMYVQGVSTRRVIEVLQRLLGLEISLSTTQVSRAAAKLDEGLKLSAS